MPEFRDDHEGICQGCLKGKHTRGPFPSSITKTIDILQLINFDLSGMLSVTSLGGCSYYMTFTDDFSRKTWIYFLKKKDVLTLLAAYLSTSQRKKPSTPQGVIGGKDLREGAVTLISTLSVLALY